MPLKGLRANDIGVTSASMRERVLRARYTQKSRGSRAARTGRGWEQTLEAAMHFSARAHDKLVKVARTVADREKAERVQSKHLAEAIQYRSLDLSY